MLFFSSLHHMQVLRITASPLQYRQLIPFYLMFLLLSTTISIVSVLLTSKYIISMPISIVKLFNCSFRYDERHVDIYVSVLNKSPDFWLFNLEARIHHPKIAYIPGAFSMSHWYILPILLHFKIE
jgi:hypothetical protein